MVQCFAQKFVYVAQHPPIRSTNPHLFIGSNALAAPTSPVLIGIDLKEMLIPYSLKESTHIVTLIPFTYILDSYLNVLKFNFT